MRNDSISVFCCTDTVPDTLGFKRELLFYLLMRVKLVNCGYFWPIIWNTSSGRWPHAEVLCWKLLCQSYCCAKRTVVTIVSVSQRKALEQSRKLYNCTMPFMGRFPATRWWCWAAAGFSQQFREKPLEEWRPTTQCVTVSCTSDSSCDTKWGGWLHVHLLRKEGMNDRYKPGEWWHSLSRGTHLPNSRLIPRPEQQHHIITLAPAGPAWVRRRTYLFCAKLKRRSVLPKHAARSASVPGIIQRASGCWLCHTFKMSSGDTMWNDSQKPAGASRVLWLAPSFTSELGGKQKAGGEKRQKNAVSHFQFLFWQFCWLCAVLFSVVGLL